MEGGEGESQRGKGRRRAELPRGRRWAGESRRGKGRRRAEMGEGNGEREATGGGGEGEPGRWRVELEEHREGERAKGIWTEAFA